jgi:hypothetical protein
MQSENGILLLFYIFLSHGNEKKKKMKKGVRCKKGGCCVLSTSTCDILKCVARLVSGTCIYIAATD